MFNVIIFTIIRIKVSNTYFISICLFIEFIIINIIPNIIIILNKIHLNGVFKYNNINILINIIFISLNDSVILLNTSLLSLPI